MEITRLRAILALLLTLPAVAWADAVADARAAGVAEGVAREVAARAAERGVSADEALAPVIDAARRGLPGEVVAAKVLEGLSKGIPPTRVAAVARGLTDRLSEADAALADARGAGLAPPGDRWSALQDLAASLSQGVGRDVVRELVAAAHEAKGGSSDAVVAAAHALGELARRGVPPAEALPLGRALARAGKPPADVAALYDAYRAEGGKDPRPFLDEATRRIAAGRKLDDLVDRFGESPDRLVHDRAAAREDAGRSGLAGSDVGRKGGEHGLAPAERPDAARAAVPGLDDALREKARPKDGRRR